MESNSPDEQNIDNIITEPADEVTEDRDTYFFESDHVALKDNSDYRSMLRTIAILEAQRVQAIQDLDVLHESQKKALADPISFVDQLQNGFDFKFPKQQKIVSLPVINWEQYTNNMDFKSLTMHKHTTRLKNKVLDSANNNSDGNVMSGTASHTSSRRNSQETVDASVRGRAWDETKPVTFNKLWTVEEQKRLEDLLLEYPPEEVEAKRWQKIATALGNRTSQQVASRVQKYFIKLAKAGLPVPGRLPNLTAYMRKGSHRHQRFNKFYQQPSTFLQSYEPPVYMSDEEDMMSGYYDGNSDFGALPSSGSLCEDDLEEDKIPLELRNTQEYRELLMLKNLRKVKLQKEAKSNIKHIGYKCDNCGMEPITGTRFHCSDCPGSNSVDFCEACIDCPYESETHNSSHRLQSVENPVTSDLIDKDYTHFVPGDYNYLDPNYMPAT